MATETERAYLRRSFSNPSSISHDMQQGDPCRALGESISFGRYMTESLSWEKWSAFTQNRYLEEAERISKPGSVAKMKAYFEAHYKRVGAKKLAALDQASDLPKKVEANIRRTSNGTSSMNLEAEETKYRPDVNETLEKETPDVEICSSMIFDSCCSSNQTSEVPRTDKLDIQCAINGACSIISEAAETEYQVELNGSPEKETPDVELSSSLVDNPCGSSIPTKQRHSATENDRMSDTDTDAVDKCVAQACKLEDQAETVSVSVDTAETKEIQHTNVLKSEILVTTSERKVPEKKAGQKDNLKLVSKQEAADSATTKSTRAKISASLSRLTTPLRKNECSDTPYTMKSARKPLEKQKPVSKSLHILVNSDVNAVKNASPASHKPRLGKAFTPLGKIIRDNFPSSPAPSKVNLNSNSRLRQPATPQAETKRSRVALEKSFDQSRKMEQKSKSPSTRQVKPSVQSSTIFRAFNFRTEERAERRREFFHKRLDKEAETMQLLRKAKIKPKVDTRKSYANIRTNTTEEVRNDVLNNIDKIPPARALSPKHESKQASDLRRGTRSQTPQRSIHGTRSQTPQRSIHLHREMEKKKLIPTQSTSITRRKTQENTSPNILSQ